jgi:hypothetical protein
MTTGALIFAFNNEQTDYLAMAEWSARRIRQYLDIPVAVVTDSVDHERNRAFDRVINVEPQTGGTRWFEDYAATVTWHNAGRTDAYALTPWDQTLVLDADYVVCSDQLLRVLESPKDFLAHRTAMDAVNPELAFLNTFGNNQFPMWWATVMMFRKSPTAQYIFDCMQMIKNNWQHYRELYSINEKNYRNDYALSIALGIVSGHTLTMDSIPWSLLSVTPEIQLTRLQVGTADQELWCMTYQEQTGRARSLGLVGQDFHAMGKSHLEKIIASD